MIDLHARLVINWGISARIETQLLARYLNDGGSRSKPKNDLIIHSDQDSQLSSDDFTCWRKDY